MLKKLLIPAFVILSIAGCSTNEQRMDQMYRDVYAVKNEYRNLAILAEQGLIEVNGTVHRFDPNSKEGEAIMREVWINRQAHVEYYNDRYAGRKGYKRCVAENKKRARIRNIPYHKYLYPVEIYRPLKCIKK